jgi:hypothetical protein
MKSLLRELFPFVTERDAPENVALTPSFKEILCAR